MTTYSSLEVIGGAHWIPTAAKAAQQGNAQDLPRPTGFDGCSFTCNYYLRADGSVRWSLSYRLSANGKNTAIARWTTDWLPDERVPRPQQPVKTNGKPVTIKSGVHSWTVRVAIDSLGLPVPIPEATR